MSAEGYDYDLFVIGCGSAGMRATRWAKTKYNVEKVGTCDMPFDQVRRVGLKPRSFAQPLKDQRSSP